MTAPIHLYQLSLTATAAKHSGEDASDRSDLRNKRVGIDMKAAKDENQTVNTANRKQSKGLSYILYLKLQIPD